ncbi:MAG: CARDB domain-containing protein [Candidatus Bathyarchaeota archaeon]|nr:CARDB domain-containing protein [Candidatus Bathyarchaeum tardum]
MKRLLKNKKALSPVVAAIILIAVTVAVSIAVAAWMGSLTIGFMETSELTVVDAMFVNQTTPLHNDLINVTVTNSGTADVRIGQVRVNGETQGNWDLTSGLTVIAPGETDHVEINLAADDAWTQGNKYSINFFAPDGTLIGSFTRTA